MIIKKNKIGTHQYQKEINVINNTNNFSSIANRQTINAIPPIACNDICTGGHNIYHSDKLVSNSSNLYNRDCPVYLPSMNSESPSIHRYQIPYYNHRQQKTENVSPHLYSIQNFPSGCQSYSSKPASPLRMNNSYNLHAHNNAYANNYSPSRCLPNESNCASLIPPRNSLDRTFPPLEGTTGLMSNITGRVIHQGIADNKTINPVSSHDLNNLIDYYMQPATLNNVTEPEQYRHSDPNSVIGCRQSTTLHPSKRPRQVSYPLPPVRNVYPAHRHPNYPYSDFSHFKSPIETVLPAQHQPTYGTRCGFSPQVGYSLGDSNFTENNLLKNNISCAYPKTTQCDSSGVYNEAHAMNSFSKFYNNYRDYSTGNDCQLKQPMFCKPNRSNFSSAVSDHHKIPMYYQQGKPISETANMLTNLPVSKRILNSVITDKRVQNKIKESLYRKKPKKRITKGLTDKESLPHLSVPLENVDSVSKDNELTNSSYSIIGHRSDNENTVLNNSSEQSTNAIVISNISPTKEIPREHHCKSSNLIKSVVEEVQVTDGIVTDARGFSKQANDELLDDVIEECINIKDDDSGMLLIDLSSVECDLQNSINDQIITIGDLFC